VNTVGRSGHDGRLIRLQLADEMPPQVQSFAFSGFAGEFLGLIFANVNHSEVGETTDIAGWPGLCHDNNGQVARVSITLCTHLLNVDIQLPKSTTKLFGSFHQE